MHLLADISSHGYGHLALSAPVLNRLAERRPELRLTVRSDLPLPLLRERLVPDFACIAEGVDTGFVMHDTLSVDIAGSAQVFGRRHADWASAVAAEARWLQSRGIDRVLSNIAYLPLAGARRAGIPAAALCCLNWADLFAYFFGGEAWAAAIHADMLDAYRAAATFLRPAPAMPMPQLDNVLALPPIAARGCRRDLGLGGERAVLVALGGIAHRLPVEVWPRLPGVRWIVPTAWECRHPDIRSAASFDMSFHDLLCSVDAVVTKPGYGTFAEAACNGVPVLYLRRNAWPEQDYLIEWLQAYAACREISADALSGGDLLAALHDLWRRPRPPLPQADGAERAAAWLDAFCSEAGGGIA